MYPTNIILIGMMGSGKTTVGQLLAARTDYTYIDTDELLTRQTGRSISEIFAADGEAEFRRLESAVILQVTTHEKQVIATGGGVILRLENVAALRQTGVVIFLAATPETLLRRLRGDTHRPLLQGGNPAETLQYLLEERLPLYQGAAHLTVDTDRLTPAEVVEVIQQKIQGWRE